MTAVFDAAIAAALQGRVVSHTWLLELQLLDGTLRYNLGGDPITSGGYRWQGGGTAQDIDTIDAAIGGGASVMTASFSGVNLDIMALVRDNFATQAKRRKARVALQMLQARGYAPLGDPVFMFAGRMARPKITLRKQQDGVISNITIQAENINVLQSTALNAYYSDTDQQRRFPGDKGLEYAASLVNQVTPWP